VIADRQAQQIQLPGIEFDPKKWAEDAISAVLQDLGDGIRAGMDALWEANFITQTPPSLTYQNADVKGLYTTMQRIANAARDTRQVEKCSAPPEIVTQVDGKIIVAAPQLPRRAHQQDIGRKGIL